MFKEDCLLNGIDISKWQQGIDLQSVPADFVICQACFGSSPQPTFKEQIEGAMNAGKLAGAYIFITGQNGEMQAFISAVSPYAGKAVLALDWEADNNAQWGNLNYLADCIQAVKSAFHVNPLVYFPANAYGRIKPLLDKENCGAWVAQYADDNPTGYQSQPWNEGAYDMAMFQYSSSGRLPGYDGSLDLDLFYGDRGTWGAYAGSDAFTSQEIAAFAQPAIENRSVYIRFADGMYLVSLDGRPQKRPLPCIWYCQKNDDGTLSFADPWGNWITNITGDEWGVLKGNGEENQRVVVDDGYVLPAQNRNVRLFDSPFSFYPADRSIHPEGLPDNASYALKLASGDWYIGDEGLLQPTPYWWKVLAHSDGSLSFMNAQGKWLTFSPQIATSTAPLTCKIGNGRPSQNWILCNGRLYPQTAPYLAIDCPDNAPENGKRLWIYTANGTEAQNWDVVKQEQVQRPEAKPTTPDITDHREYLKHAPATKQPKKDEDKMTDTTAKPATPITKATPTDDHDGDQRREKLIGDAVGAIEKDVNDGSLMGDAGDIADKMSGLIEEALDKKALSRKAMRWVFMIAITVALACIVLSALALAHCLPAWVAGLCAMIMGGTGLGAHSLGISATTK